MKDFDIFRNTDDMTVENIARSYPVLTGEEKERMFAMSERKFNIKEKKYPQRDTSGTDEELYDEEDDVEGVEEYDRPLWLKFLSTAAVLMLIGGGLAAGRNLLRRRPSPDNVAPPTIATVVSTGTQTTDVTDSDNVTYTIDVDSMLTGVNTGGAVPETTTTLAAAVTQAPAAPAPTEAPKETTAPADNIEEYEAAARVLAENRIKLWSVTGDMQGRYYDYSDSFTAYYDPTGGDEPLAYEYVRFNNPDFRCVNDFWTLIRNTFTYDYGNWMYSGTYNIASVEPGTVQPYNNFAYFTDYHGQLYCWASDPETGNPANTDYYYLSAEEKPFISSVTDTFFHAVIPIHSVNYNDEENTFMLDMLVVKENGQWLIDGSITNFSDELSGISYDTYLRMINGLE